MLTSTTGRLASAAIATVAGLAVLAPAAHAAPAKQAAKLTVPAYEKYLKQQSAPAAKKAAAQFAKLNKNQKQVFVKTLQDQKVYKALTGKAWGKIRNVTTVDRYNKNVTFVTKASFKTAKGKARTTTATFSVTEKIFNIPVTTEGATLVYPTVGKLPGTTTASTDVFNINAAIRIDATSSVKGNDASGRITALPRVKSFGKKAVKRVTLHSTKQAFIGQLVNQK
ncbi:hypothetical protein [Streptomyces sp. HUAS TT20]|uniref:hypothetical protein n=1 Tax=Streptomyces sp. HUAS TT20 TaxID=3447509 RepID=UPI0021DB7272|nr:hypothetical protein [Streptomyces sp. HUAS 15-9]UXY30821.1 hypothetical protein N8I87_32550 [Streptomyces sp. HUAS 15-9]